MNQPTNPERELKTVGLGFVEQPYFATRGQLLETRRELMKKECEDLRARSIEECIPMSVRRAEKEADEFEFRRPLQEPMTLTKLKDERKRTKVEYDLANFNYPEELPRAYPKFSDRPDVPFWVSDNAVSAGTPPPRMMARGMSEPALKITDIPFRDDSRDVFVATSGIDVPAGKPIGAAEARLGSKTVKKWTTDMLERGQGRNKPRIFDNIQPALPGPRDLDHLDMSSSMEPIRTAALRRRAQERMEATDRPRKSRLYVDPNQNAGFNPGVHFQKPVQPSITEPLRAETSATVSVPVPHNMDATAPARASRRNASEAVLRGTAAAREPRFFGSMTRAMSQSGVRCGGFQRLDSTQQMMRPRMSQMTT